MPRISFAEAYPQVALEWSPKNQLGPQSYARCSHVSVWWICQKGHEWQTSLLNRGRNRSGCPYCKGKRLTPEISLASKFPDLVSEWASENKLRPDLVHAFSGKSALWRCKQGHLWEAVIASRASGRGCPYCSGNIADPKDNFKTRYPELVAEWWDARDPATITRGSDYRATWICAKQHIWSAPVRGRTIRGEGCPFCTGKLASPESNLAVEFPDLMKEWSPRNLLLPTDYRPFSAKRVWWKCRKGHEWEGLISHRTASGSGCPHCFTPRAQNELAEWLESLGFTPETNRYKVLQNRQQLDVWLPEKRLAIEYCGIYWHSEEYKEHNYHLDKLRQCELQGIRLITLFENEWVSQKEAVKAYISSVLGTHGPKAGARSTELDTSAPWASVAEFLDDHHIQRRCTPGQYCATLSHEGRTVAAMVCKLVTSSRARVGAAKRWELTRYCVRGGWQVQGGFQRLWKAFLRLHTPTSVVSFSDRRWSAGELYERAGFHRDGDTRPSYWYFKDGRVNCLYHKSQFRKSRIQKKFGLLEGETEAEAMDRLGYRRIWDCGLTRWIWRS